jgi:recombinational DNA repair ATPase RecF
MNLLELEIRNIRGIPNLLLKPDGRNLAIWGLNGSGKSAVVDAIDFLLTGQISRLIGEGAGEISLNKHGPHILHKLEEASVRAKIKLPLIKEPVEIKRCMATSGAVEINCEAENKEWVEFILWNAKKGQHVLTRREILKYIHAEPRSRAERIQDILNISDIEDIRRALVTVKNKAGEDHSISKNAVDAAEGSINATISQTTYSQEALLEFVNKNREILGGKRISAIASETIQKDIRKPADAVGVQGVNAVLLEKDIGNIRSALSKESRDEIAQNDRALRDLITRVRSDPKLLKIFSRLQLAEIGVKLIDESGSCPLCDSVWKPGELANYLREKISKGKGFAEDNKSINRLSSAILGRINNLAASVRALIAAGEKIGAEKEKTVFQSWLERLEAVLGLLNSPLEKYPEAKFGTYVVQTMLAPDGIEKTLVNMSTGIKEKVPQVTPELNAWDALTRLGENLKALEKAKVRFKKSALYQKRAASLLTKFLSARDSILGTLYDAVRDRFVDFYRQLHKVDESKFKAIMKPVGAGLNFEVDFYGQGSHPPHALHSEGHQDSMGICLYLALTERLNEGLINLIILDDVVMSVDVEHRRQVCSLLAKSFPNKQFIITTHDRTWANQLKSEGVVKSRDLIEFHNWSLEGGPQVNYDVILWEEITENLERNNVPDAAAQLRRGLEGFFSEVCGSLRASVEYNVNHRWELGDWCPAAMRQYRELIKRGLTSAC